MHACEHYAEQHTVLSSVHYKLCSLKNINFSFYGFVRFYFQKKNYYPFKTMSHMRGRVNVLKVFKKNAIRKKMNEVFILLATALFQFGVNYFCFIAASDVKIDEIFKMFAFIHTLREYFGR